MIKINLFKFTRHTSHKPMSYEEAFKQIQCMVVFGLDGLPYQSFAYRKEDGEYLLIKY